MSYDAPYAGGLASRHGVEMPIDAAVE